MFIKILELIQSNQVFYCHYVTIGNPSALNLLDPRFLKQISATLPFQNHYLDKDEFQYHLDFFNGGMAALIRRWLRNDTLVAIIAKKIQTA